MKRVPANCGNVLRLGLKVYTKKTSLDRGRTDRISLTHDLDLEIAGPILTRKSSRSMVSRFQRYRVDTNGRTDGRRRLHPPSLMWSGNI